MKTLRTNEVRCPHCGLALDSKTTAAVLGKKGGRARMHTMTAAQRSEIARRGAIGRWGAANLEEK